jgi:asparagine synthetase B (glutamine-hydrolysing)
MAELTVVWGDPNWVQAACDRLALPFRRLPAALEGRRAASLWMDEDAIPDSGGSQTIGDLDVAWVGAPDAGPQFLATLSSQSRSRGAASGEVERAVAEAPGVLSGCIWSRSSGGILGFRDRAGLIPIYFGEGSRSSGVVSTIAPHIWRARGGAPSPNVPRLARFLRFAHDDGSEDFVDGVERVRPAEIVRFEAGRALTRDNYWHPDEGSKKGVGESREFSAAFEAAVSRAATDRCSTISMSGGLDSTSIAAVLAQQQHATRARPYEVTSMVFPRTLASDESAELDEMERSLPLRIHRFDMDDVWPLQDLSFYTSMSAVGPWGHPGGEYELAFWRRTHALGFRHVLTGVGADQMLSMPRRRLMQSLWRQQRFAELLQVAKHEPSQRLIRSVGRWALEGIGMGAMADRAVALRNATGDFLRNPHAVDDWVIRRGEEQPGATPTRRPGRDPRLEGLRRCEWDETCRRMRELARASRSTGAHPMLDHQLWRLTLRLSPEVVRTGDHDKGVLRAAMVGRLPEPIRLRPKLKHFGQHVNRGLAGFGAETVERIFRTPRLSEIGLIDAPSFRAAYRRYRDDARAAESTGRSVSCMAVWRTVAAELWLHALM